MKIRTSYTVPIKKQVDKLAGRERCVNERLMRCTSDVCLDALKYCAGVFLGKWEYLSSFPVSAKAGVLSRRRAADILIHSTKENTASYPEFDERFHHFPSYMRRAVIAKGLGMVSSYISNHKNWEGLPAGERGSEPVVGFPPRYELTFYDQERDLCSIEKGIIRLRLYNGKTWNWHSFRIQPSDARYISRMKDAESTKMLSPIVEKVRGRYRIRFAFEQERELVSNENPLS